jgi:putative nucleotidyltransferase with HDIG domain
MLELRLPARSRVRPDDPDPEAVRLVQESRARLAGRLSARELWASLLVGGGFLATAVALAVAHESARSPSAATIAGLVVAYAITFRIRFEIASGHVVPTQIVLVPMLFFLPLGWVPLAVAGGILLAQLPSFVRDPGAVKRAGFGLVSAWHAVGPAAVLIAAGERAPSLSDWRLYLAALAAQFAADLVAGTVFQLISTGISPRAELHVMGVAYGVDAALAPIGLFAAIACYREPTAVLLVLPLAAVFAVFAQQRRSAIDSAVALGSAYRGAAELLVDFVEDADAYTGDHSKQIVELVLQVCDELGVDSRGRRDAELAALLHDVGKMRVPRALITKPAALTPDERELIETHTVEGERILARVGGLLGEVGSIVRSCHERWDGQGYPDGLAGEAIPLVARVVSCCDAYNAMTTDRPYRSALAADDALYELRVHAGTQFDPAVVDALVRVLARAERASAA